MIAVLISNLVFVYLFIALTKKARDLRINGLVAFCEVLFVQAIIIALGIGIFYLISILLAFVLSESTINSWWGNLAILAIYAADYFGTTYILEDVIFPRQKKDIETELIKNSNELINSESIKVFRKGDKIKMIILTIMIDNSKRLIEFSKIRFKNGIYTGESKNEKIEVILGEESIKYKYFSHGTLMNSGEEIINTNSDLTIAST